MPPESTSKMDHVALARPQSPSECPADAVCPWCGDKRSQPVWRRPPNAEFSLCRCEKCGLVFTTPQLTPQAIADFYPASYYGEGNLRFSPLFEALVGWFRRRRAARL